MIHGEVKVNDISISSWSAENTGQVVAGEVLYECRVWGRDGRGYPYDHQFIFMHSPKGGALALTWGILQKATQFTKG